MKALAVIDKNLGLGYQNDLLFHLPTDLAHFKKHTLGQTVVMGQKTLESMPGGKPLPGRNTLVLNLDAPTGKICDVPCSKAQPLQLKQFVCYTFQSIDDFHKYIAENESELGDIVLSGGATIYKLLIDECDELIMTEVDAEAENVDVYFPEFRDKFVKYDSLGHFNDGNYAYSINCYKRK